MHMGTHTACENHELFVRFCCCSILCVCVCVSVFGEGQHTYYVCMCVHVLRGAVISWSIIHFWLISEDSYI